MTELKMLNNLLNGCRNHCEHVNAVTFYVATNEILDKYPSFLHVNYLNTLSPIITDIKKKYDVNGLYDNIVLKILESVEQIRTSLCLDEADYLMLLHKDKCIAKLKNLKKVNSKRSICIDMTELLVMMNKMKYNQEILSCVVGTSILDKYTSIL